MKAATRTHAGYCPHCQLLVDTPVGDPWPGEPTRCPHCHLLIGSGRGLPEPSGERGTKGTAAGVFSRRASRDEGKAESTPEEVLEGIREVARSIGAPPDRLLMVDYQQIVTANPGLPALKDVFAVYGSWKSARRRAVE